MFSPVTFLADVSSIYNRESPTTAVNESFTCTSPVKKKKSTTDLEANYQDAKFDYESMISHGGPDKPSAAVELVALERI